MLGALRRGSTLAPRILSSASSIRFRSTNCSSSLLQLSKPANISASTSRLRFRTIVQTIRCQSNAAAALAEELPFEGELEHEVNGQKPPSDSEIDQDTNHGPITKYQELADRGLVDKNVIKTITSTMRIETMTQVQSMTINETLKGADV